MKSKETDRPYGRDIRSGLALALFFLWISLNFPAIVPRLSDLTLPRGPKELALIFVVLAGFSLALLLDRFWPKVWRSGLQFIALLCLLSLTPLCSYVDIPFLLSVLISVLSVFLLAFLSLPLIQTIRTMDTAVRVCGTACVFLFITAWPVARLAQTLQGVWFQAPHIALSCVLLAAAILLGPRVIRENTPATPKEESFRPVRFAPVVCVGLALSELVCGASIVSLFGVVKPQSDWPLIIGLILAAAAMAALCVLMLLRNVPYVLAYCATCGFSLGFLFRSLSLPDPWRLLLPLAAFALAGIAMALLLLICCFHLVSPINRVFSMALCFAFLFAVIVFLTSAGAPPWESFVGGDSPILSLGLAAVFLFSPLLFFVSRTPVKKGKPPTKDEPKPAVSAAVASAAVAPADLLSQLTMAEKRVYELVVCGYANQQMADMLFISINTVKFHIKNILAKAGVSKKSQLVTGVPPKSRADAQEEP